MFDFTEKTAKDAEIAENYQRKILLIRAIRGFFGRLMFD